MYVAYLYIHIDSYSSPSSLYSRDYPDPVCIPRNAAGMLAKAARKFFGCEALQPNIFTLFTFQIFQCSSRVSEHCLGMGVAC